MCSRVSWCLNLRIPKDTAAVTRTLQAHSLRGTLEVASSGVAFYKPLPDADDAQVTCQTSNGEVEGPDDHAGPAPEAPNLKRLTAPSNDC